MGERADEMRTGRHGAGDYMPDDIYGARPSSEISGAQTPTHQDYDPGDASPDEIRDDIEDTRAEMSETIDAIQDRLNPDRLKSEAKDAVREQTIGRAEQALSDVSDSARGTGETIMDTIRNNPVPAAMVGIGLGWLMMRGRESSNVRSIDRVGRSEYRAQPYSRYGYGYAGQHERGRERGMDMGERTGEMQQRAGEYAGEAQQRASEYASDIQERAGEFTDRAQHQAQRLEDRFTQMMRENPLAMGAIALGIGTAVGLLVPETQKEDQWMGEARDTLMERAQETAQEKMEQARHVAEEAQQAVQEEAENQGLTSS